MPGGMFFDKSPDKGAPALKIPNFTKPSFSYEQAGPPESMTTEAMSQKYGIVKPDEVRTQSQMKTITGKESGEAIAN